MCSKLNKTCASTLCSMRLSSTALPLCHLVRPVTGVAASTLLSTQFERTYAFSIGDNSRFTLAMMCSYRFPSATGLNQTETILLFTQLNNNPGVYEQIKIQYVKCTTNDFRLILCTWRRICMLSVLSL